jgi:hypothetical protein
MNQRKELCWKRSGSLAYGSDAATTPRHSAKENKVCGTHETHWELLNRSIDLPTRGGWF